MATGAVPARIVLAAASFDAAKLEFEPDTDDARIRLKYLLSESDDFANLNDWTEVDSGGNVNLAGGVVSINGNDNWNQNGIYHTTGVTRAEGYFEFKVTSKNAAFWDILGTSYTNSLDANGSRNGAALFWRQFAKTFRPSLGAGTLTNTKVLTTDAWYTIRLYVYNTDAARAWDEAAISIEGGTEYPTETVLVRAHGTLTYGTWLDPINFQFNRRNNNAAALTEVKEWRWYTGFAQDDPVVTLADIDSGAAGSVWDMSTIDFAGSEAGLTFSYAYGAGAAPANWSAYLSLANLKLEVDPTGRYFKLRVKVSSDGATQREVTEGSINCAISGGALTPTGTAITGVALVAPGLVRATWPAGANADRYCIFCNETAIGAWTEDGVDHINTVPGGQTSCLIAVQTPAGAQFHDATYAFGVKGKNDASGLLDANTTELTLAVTPQGVGTARVTTVDIEKFFGNASRVPVAGEAGGEPLDVKVSDIEKVRGGRGLRIEDWKQIPDILKAFVARFILPGGRK